MLELSIQEAFLRFMACLMKGYKNYLKEVVRPTGDPNLESTNMRSLFDMQGEIKPRGYKTFFMLNSTEHKIQLLIKIKIPTNKEVSCFKSLRCCIYHAYNC